jgi:hypothetical protein
MPTQAQISLNPTSSKGDIFTSDGSSRARLSVGTNGQILTARSTATNGIQWETPPANESTFELISTTSITSDVTSVTFSSIANSYDELHVYGFIKSSSADTTLAIRINSNTTLNYQWIRMGINDTTVNNNYDGNANFMRLNTTAYNVGAGSFPAIFKTTIRTGINVMPRIFSQYYFPTSSATNAGDFFLSSGVLDSVFAPVSSVTVAVNASSPSVFSLYGLRRS